MEKQSQLGRDCFSFLLIDDKLVLFFRVILMSQYNLNQSQQEAVEYTSGPLLIIAGAGTGKTTVITQKIAYLIENKLATPEQILAVTFTEKAAEEMLNRVDEVLDIGYVDLQISTFHAFCQRLLEQYGLNIGLPNQFKLLTPTEAWLLIRQNLDKFNLDYYRPLGNPTRHIHELIKHFSKCKDELITPADYLKYAEEVELNKDSVQTEEKSRLTEIASAFHTYNQLLLDNNSLDFGDLIFYAIKLFKERPNVLQVLQNRFKYILVDEFQDVNWAQYQLVRLLGLPVMPCTSAITSEALEAGKAGQVGGQLTVVGDDDQSIYAFRGASVSNILRFKDDYPNAKEIVLTENYRSGQKILDLAYQSIQNNNPDRLEAKLKINKSLKSKAKSQKSEVEYVHCATLDDEVRYVVKQISDIGAKELVDYSDIAILVRANSHTEPFINALEKANIPYEYQASFGLFHQPIILDCFNFLKVIDSYHESAAVYRLLRLPFLNFFENDLQKFTYLAKKKSISYYEALKRTAEFNLSEEGLKICDKMLNLIHEGMKQSRTEKPTVVLYNFLENSGYLRYLAHEEVQNNRTMVRQIHFLKQFLDQIARFEASIPGAQVSSFLENFNYILEAGDEGSLKSLDNVDEAIKIMTIHSAKGLEFKYIFVVNLVEERFPTRKRGEGIEIPLELIKEHLPEGDYHYQEERRLFYVAVTRAKEKLFLTSAEDYGGTRKKKISRFLDEVGYTNLTPQPSSPQTIIVKESNDLTVDKNFGEKHTDVNETGYFSYSQINSYQRCPYQYKLAHVLHLPTKGNASFSFGQTMHSTLQQFYRQVCELNLVKQNSLFDSIIIGGDKMSAGGTKVPTLDELLELYDKNWCGDWYQSKKQREDYYQKGKEILKVFYAAQENNWTVPVTLEGGFKIKIGDCVLGGRIDRIDKLADGTLEIIDYKTGQAKEKISGDDKEQLLIYQTAVQLLPEYKNIGQVGKLTFYYLNDNLKVSFVGDAEELQKLQEKLLKVIALLRSGNFAATPSQHVCSHCDFKDICEYRIL